MEIGAVQTEYELALSKIKSFYDLDNYTPIGARSKVYLIKRSSRDYEFIRTLFKPEHANHNISKMKQMSCLIDFIHYVEEGDTPNKNSELRIEIYDCTPEDEARGLVQVSFGSIFNFSMSIKSTIIPEEGVFLSRYFQRDLMVDNELFEEKYAELLATLPKFVDKDLTLQEFIKRDKKTFAAVRFENLKNPELTYCVSSDFDHSPYDETHDTGIFFNSLKTVFSKNLIQQVKAIESLLRFESFLNHGRCAYTFDFHQELTTYKFRLPVNVYAVVFDYEGELNLNIKLYFNYSINMIRYLEIDYETNKVVDVSGYEDIYDLIFNRIKTLITSKLGVTADELTNQSLLLYKMMQI